MAKEILRPNSPPKHLSLEAKRIWRQINETWDLEHSPDALLILRTGLEAFDRLQQARKQLDDEGLTIQVPLASGEHRIQKHPAAESEKAARSGLLQAMRMLGLELEASGLTGRKG